MSALVYKVICWIDAPEVLDAAITPIPANSNSPLQVVAALPKSAFKLRVSESIGEMIGIYVGDVGSEQLQCVVYTDGEYPISVGRKARISIRNMGNTTINFGKLCLQFLGDT